MKRSADRTKSPKPATTARQGSPQARLPQQREISVADAARPELLAPCGSLESFFAAMESGADAVYAGLRDFSARARAKNFTLGQMERMLAYAHNHGRRIYITLNTLIKEQELPPLVETLAELARLRVDGVIVQDMAVARLVRTHFPSIPLHASTQMTIHNLPGVQLLEELGFERVVLARELPLQDIAAIAAQCRAELEIFIHGALCFCVSGQCHFSSLLGGHSGNRGRCAQPCRRLYTSRSKEGYYFSPNDLSAIELLPELVAAGVKSLKIEGRMKSADYVAKVVSAYRLALDAPPGDWKTTLGRAKELLKDSFGRTPTKGFMGSREPNDIANPWLRGGTGRFIGEIRKAAGGRLQFETRDALHVGDRLRLQPKSDQAGTAWTLRELYLGRKKALDCPGGSQVEVVCPFEAKPGDALFRVGAHDAFSLSDEAANRRLQAAGADKVAVRLQLACSANEQGWTLAITARIGAALFDYEFQLGDLQPARQSDLTGVLTARFGETGETPFRLAELTAPDFPALFIPPARLKEIRRELYRLLEQDGAGRQRRAIAAAREAALQTVRDAANAAGRASEIEELLLLVEGPGDARWAFSLADTVVIPLRKATIHALPRHLARLREQSERVVWQLPFMLFDNDLPLYRDLLHQLHQQGFRRFEVANHGHLPLMRGLTGLRLSAAYRLFSVNSQTLTCWQELGCERATLYLEDDRANLSDLLGLSLPIQRTVTVYAPVEVMTTRIRIKELASGAAFESDRGERYTLRGRDGLSVISAATPFSLIGHLADLRRMGCRSFLLDLSETPSEQRAAVLEAYRCDRRLSGATDFNYERGLA